MILQFRHCSFVAFVLLAFAFAPAGAQTGADAAPASAQRESADESERLPVGAVALVNDAAISVETFQEFLKAYIAQNYYHGMAAEKLPGIADDALELLITDRLLLQEARKRKLEGDPQAVKDRLKALKARYARSPESSAMFDRKRPAIENELLDETRIEALRATVRDAGELSPAEVRRFYEENPQLFTTPPATDLSIILIGVPPHGVAEEWRKADADARALRERIVNGEAFSAAAEEFSAHSSAAEGGRLGAVHDGQLQENVAAAVNELAIGAVSQPMRILEGVAIFKVNDRISATLQPFDAVEDRAQGLLRRKLEESRWEDLLADLRRSARIRKADSLVEYVRDL